MHNVMTGQQISFRNKIESAWAIYTAHRRGDFSDAAGDVQYHHQIVAYYEQYVDLPLAQARVLDLGCGQTATQTALFRADGANVTGIDVEIPTYHLTPSIFMQILKRHGIERALKSTLRHHLFDARFFGEISRHYGRLVAFSGLDARVMDASAMTFADSSFDLVHSMAVFEHVEDVPAVIRELNRVLKPGGIAIVTPHLFPSVSGGHCLEWLWPDRQAAENVEPWDHLRENAHPADTYLNRLKLADYREMLSGAMEIVDEKLTTEGAGYLTDALFSELSAKGYTREDLLTRTATFFARKKP